MSVFKRSGFWRAGRHGGQHWVSGHQVERNDWSRSSMRSFFDVNPQIFRESLQKLNATGSFASRLVIPNANCPVCGDWVFFFQNEHGSKVWFDELGPPWPKHRCMNNTEDESSSGIENGPNQPILRTESEVQHVRFCYEKLNWDPSVLYRDRIGRNLWPACLIMKRFDNPSSTYLVIREHDRSVPRTVYLKAAEMPAALTEGALAFLKRKRVCFFDFASMQPQEIEITRIRNAKVFIEELAGIEQD